MMTLVGYWRSSCSWRVRLALAHKGISYAHAAINLKAGEQLAPGYRAHHPMGQVPLLKIEGHPTLSQSMAIIEYLEECYPQAPLLPEDPHQKAQARALAEVINSSIQPLQNLSVLKRISMLDANPQNWARSVIGDGLDALEAMVAGRPGPFLMGPQLTVPDLFLVPQIYNARRFGCDTARWPRLTASEAAVLAQPHLRTTHPNEQHDADAQAA